MGLFGDSRIYVGRALATLDPAGVGRDIMFAYDHQSGFSIFPQLFERLVAAFGAARSAMATAIAALLVWTGATALLVRSFNREGPFWVNLCAVLAAPTAYGGFQLSIGEAAPLPRPFAEAFVILGLWAAINERRLWSVCLMGVAAIVHPIMALPGLAVVGVLLVLDDRRWLLLAGAGVVSALSAAAIHAPFFDRLLIAMDDDWLRVLRICSPSLFLRLWPASLWTQIAVQAVTLGLAAALLSGRLRQLILATLLVTALTLAASAILGDAASRVLVVQAQPWRALWLLSLLAAVTFPVLAQRLWGNGACARLALGSLGCAWLSVLLPSIALASALASVILFLVSRRVHTLRASVVAGGWALLGLLATVVLVAQTMSVLAIVAHRPEQARLPLHGYALLDVYRTCAMVLILAAGTGLRAIRWLRASAPFVSAAALIFAMFSWNAPSSSRRLLVSAVAAQQVHVIVANRMGAVEWLGGDLEPIMLAGRPAWQTEVQAASSVFSREQAVIWVSRARRLVATGVGPPALVTPFPHPAPATLWSPAASALSAFCAFQDAPAWVVEPLAPTAAPPKGAVIWQAPIAEGRTSSQDSVVLINRYAFIPCR